jgi:hypothetical protein
MKKQRTYRPATAIQSVFAATRIALTLLLMGLLAGPLASRTAAQETKVDPSRIIQYRGPMPLLAKEHWGGDVRLKFELYRSPDGGSPFWKETRSVSVRKDGWVNVDLGQVQPLPDEAFTTPFRFLSIWHEAIEFAPRKQIASLAYIAVPVEQQILAKAAAGTAGGVLARVKADGVASPTPNPEQRPGQLIDCGLFQMEKNPRSPMNWLSAVENAGRLGARLPTFEEWYGAYDSAAGRQLIDMEGHYEWVIPWVYEPTIHARLHELYRGKPVACYYEELSPMNDYAFRLVVEGRPATQP